MSIVSGEDIMIVNCSFEDSIGTALGAFYSNLNLHGNNFTNNCNGHSSRSHGLVAKFFTNTSTTFFLGNKISNNSAKYGGGIYAYNSTLNLTGNSIFSENSAEYGGGISTLNSILNFTGDSSFTDLHCWKASAIGRANPPFRMMSQVLFSPHG